MNGNTQKPFACKMQGCGMSFTNEDHLNAHEKKHEMILNLGLENKSTSVFVSDQTPTPTRLIKNCEEVGLFDDLKHVNPFDETFRRAVESKQSETTTNVNETTFNSQQTNDCLITNHNEESLHTPQVFPNISATTTTTTTDSSLCHREDFQVIKQQQEQEQVILSTENINNNENNNNDEKSEVNNNEDNSNKTLNLKNRKSTIANSNNKNKINKQDKKKNSNTNNKNLGKCFSASSSKRPATYLKSSELQPIAAKPVILPSTINIIQPQIIAMELPEAAILPSKSILIPKTIQLANIFPKSTTQLPHQLSSSSSSSSQFKMITIKEKLKNVLNNHNSPSKKIVINKSRYFPRKGKEQQLSKNSSSFNNNDANKNNSSHESNDDSLERRRAAAMRYRKKIKLEQDDLRIKNTQLIAENEKLKETITQLKQILVKHQNCDVTRSTSVSSSSLSSSTVGSALNLDLISNVISIVDQQQQQRTLSNNSNSSTISSVLEGATIESGSTIQIPTIKFLINMPQIVGQQQQPQSIINFIKKS